MPEYYEYAVDFIPLRPFHFSSLSDQRLGNSQDYYHRGSFFPAQTAVMGTIRKLIACAVGGMDPNARPIKDGNKLVTIPFDRCTELAHLIGKAAWQSHGNTAKDGNPFGIIDAVSPLLLRTGGEDYIYSPNEFDLDVSKKASMAFSDTSNGTVNYPLLDTGGQVATANQLGELDAKKSPTSAFRSLTSDSVLKADAVSKKITREHVNTRVRDDEDREGYYIIEYTKLLMSGGFRCYLRLTHEIDPEMLNGYTMPLGGNDNVFQIEVSTSTLPSSLKHKPSDVLPKSDVHVVLVSPAPLKDNYRLFTKRVDVSSYVHTHVLRMSGSELNRRPDFAPIQRWADRGSTLWLSPKHALSSSLQPLSEVYRKQGFGYFAAFPTPINTSAL